MGQGEVIVFLQREYRKGNREGFTKKEIEGRIGKRFNNHSLLAMMRYGEVERETKTVHGNQKKYSYKYKPKDTFSIYKPPH